MSKEALLEIIDADLTNEQKQAIIDKVSELKKQNSALKVVFPIVIEGSEYDAKERYIAYFKQPNFASFSKYLSASQTNPAVAMRTLANECFLDGDRELLEDDSLFLFGLMTHLTKVIQVRSGKLVNLSKTGK